MEKFNLAGLKIQFLRFDLFCRRISFHFLHQRRTYKPMYQRVRGDEIVLDTPFAAHFSVKHVIMATYVKFEFKCTLNLLPIRFYT